MEIYTKSFQQVIDETLERRLITPQETISLAKRMHRIQALKHQFGFSEQNNVKAYRAKLNTTQTTLAKAKRMQATANKVKQIVATHMQGAY